MSDPAPPARTRIKICGVKDLGSAEAAVAAGADLIGLVFVQKSPRYIPPADAAKIVAALPPGVEPVGLFSDHSAADVLEAARLSGVHTVQLHGREGPGMSKQLAPLRVIKAISFESSHLAERLQPWREAMTPLTAILIDSPAPLMYEQTQGLTGGSGESFDWSDLARLEQEGVLHDLPPRILAGGLDPANVGEAIRIVRPYAVDVSSGVESSRGVKDAGKIAAFCDAVRQADLAAAGS